MARLLVSRICLATGTSYLGNMCNTTMVPTLSGNITVEMKTKKVSLKMHPLLMATITIIVAATSWVPCITKTARRFMQTRLSYMSFSGMS